MNLDDENKINKLNSSLYSRNAPDIRTKRRLRFHEQETDIKTDWDHPTDELGKPVELNQEYKDKSMSFFTKILIASVIFFFTALGVGAYLIYNGSNIVSANNVDIYINGPVSIAGGEPVFFEIQVSNKNNIKLETVDLAIDFPAGTIDADDSLRELKNFRELIPDINPGGVGQKSVKVILYGEENTKRQIKVAIEYRVKGSNAIFLKEKTFDILISSTPLNLSVSSFKEVNSGQEFEMTVVVNSNSKEIVKGLLLKAVYPFGYSYISSDLKPINNNSIWKIGDMPPGGKKTFKIKGKLEGQDDESRVFNFRVGVARLGNDKEIATEYVASSQEVAIKKPFMTVNIFANGESATRDTLASFDSPVRLDISYFNNLNVAITNAEIYLKISGSAFDKNSVSSQEGLYRSTNSEISWNTITSRSLESIDAGGSGKVSFVVTPRNLSTLNKSIINPNLVFEVSVKGKRVSESNVPESIVSTAKKEVRVSSNIALYGNVLRSTTPFANTGSIPPRVEQPTTYTVVWNIDNSYNNVSSAVVQSSLPAYVKWLGKIDPTTEDLVYDATNGTIVWNAGSVGSNTSGTNRSKKVAFQISFTPTINQEGSAPNIINPATLSAQDDFTGQTLKSSLNALNINFNTDPSYKEGDDRVTK